MFSTVSPLTPDTTVVPAATSCITLHSRTSPPRRANECPPEPTGSHGYSCTGSRARVIASWLATKCRASASASVSGSTAPS